MTLVQVALIAVKYIMCKRLLFKIKKQEMNEKAIVRIVGKMLKLKPDIENWMRFEDFNTGY